MKRFVIMFVWAFSMAACTETQIKDTVFQYVNKPNGIAVLKSSYEHNNSDYKIKVKVKNVSNNVVKTLFVNVYIYDPNGIFSFKVRSGIVNNLMVDSVKELEISTIIANT